MKVNSKMANHLSALFENGFSIFIKYNYEKTEVTSIFENEENVWVFSSRVFQNCELSDVDVRDISVFKPANFEWRFNEQSLDNEVFCKFEAYKQDMRFLQSESQPNYRLYGFEPEYFGED